MQEDDLISYGETTPEPMNVDGLPDTPYSETQAEKDLHPEVLGDLQPKALVIHGDNMERRSRALLTYCLDYEPRAGGSVVQAIADSGATHTCTHDQRLFKAGTLKPCYDKIYIADGRAVTTRAVGTMIIPLTTHTDESVELEIENSYLVDELQDTLISISAIVADGDNHLNIVFNGSGAFIVTNLHDPMIRFAYLEGRTYYVFIKTTDAYQNKGSKSMPYEHSKSYLDNSDDLPQVRELTSHRHVSNNGDEESEHDSMMVRNSSEATTLIHSYASRNLTMTLLHNRLGHPGKHALMKTLSRVTYNGKEIRVVEDQAKDLIKSDLKSNRFIHKNSVLRGKIFGKGKPLSPEINAKPIIKINDDFDKCLCCDAYKAKSLPVHSTRRKITRVLQVVGTDITGPVTEGIG